MKKTFLTICFLFCSLPAVVLGQSDTPNHQWAVDYSDLHGLSLHRNLGENWEIFTGGWYKKSDYNNERDEYRFNNSGEYESTLNKKHEWSYTENKVHLGVSRTLIHANDFWLSGLFRLTHLWYEDWDKDLVTSTESPLPATRSEASHSNTTYLYFSLRPAYDITPRISLTFEFGLYYSHYQRTKDVNTSDPGNINYYSTGSNRDYTSQDSVRLYGYNSIYSLGFMFRF